jgi:hypothetical protein
MEGIESDEGFEDPLTMRTMRTQKKTPMMKMTTTPSP